MFSTRFLLSVRFVERFAYIIVFGSLSLLFNESGEAENEDKAIFLYGLFKYLILLLPLPAAYLADRYGHHIVIKYGFLIASIGMFLMSVPAIIQTLPVIPIIITAAGLSALVSPLIVLFFRSLNSKTPSKIIVGIVVFFGFIHIASLFAQIFHNYFIFESMSFRITIAACLSLALFILLALWKQQVIQQDNGNTFSLPFNKKLIIILIVMQLFNSVTSQLFLKSQEMQEYFATPSYTSIILVLIILIIIFSIRKVKSLQKFLEGTIYAVTLLNGLLLLFFSFFVHQNPALIPYIGFLAIVQDLVSLLLYPVLCFYFYSAFPQKYIATGIAGILFIGSVVWHISNQLPLNNPAVYLYAAPLCAVATILTAILFNKNAVQTKNGAE